MRELFRKQAHALVVQVTEEPGRAGHDDQHDGEDDTVARHPRQGAGERAGERSRRTPAIVCSAASWISFSVVNRLSP